MELAVYSPYKEQMSQTPNGMELAEVLYKQATKPLIRKHFPKLPYAAALIGPGSEVLGLDDEMSRDHHWGPRFQLFLHEEDLRSEKVALKEMLAQQLPTSILGIPVNFTEPGSDGSQMPEKIAGGPVNHRIHITTAHQFMERLLGFDPRKTPTPADWLSFSSQTLLSLTSGRVFDDNVGLHVLRNRLGFYPDDVWLYMMAAQWKRISQEEHLLGRTEFLGDEIGSRIIAARLVSNVMHLTFLQEKRYAPYAKWLERCFSDLASAAELMPHLKAALEADSSEERLSEIARCYEISAARHNSLHVTDHVSEDRSDFWSRPFPVIHAERFSAALTLAITDSQVKAIADRGLIGGVDQISDQVDFKHPHWRSSLAAIYPR